MKIEITPEMVDNLGKEWVDMLIARITPEQIIAKHGEDKILSIINSDKRLKGLKVEDRLKGLSVEEIEAYLAKLKKTKKKKAA